MPEIAARAHVEELDRIIAKAMTEAGKTFDDIDGVAAAAGPGLIGGVIVGLTTAKAIALVNDKPLIAVNHLEAHALTARLTDGTPFPYCLFLASGGHTQILAVRGVGDYVRLGTTMDDAIGEAFDKTAKLLGLGYPGGPQVEQEAARGNATRFALPRPMQGRAEADFSLSGLKTALRLEAENDRAADRPGCRRSLRVVPAGGGGRGRTTGCAPACGCSASATARRPRWSPPAASPPTRRSARCCSASPSRPAPCWWCRRRELCTDNGAMIAWAGAERLALGLTDPLDVAPRARWPLDEIAGAEDAAGACCAQQVAERMTFERIAVLGGGAWGTALANVARAPDAR